VVIVEAEAYMKPPTMQEKVIALLCICTILLWFLSTWVTFLNVITIAGVFLFVVFLFEIITWKDFVNEANWDLLFTIGSLPAIMGAISKSGAVGWIIAATMINISEVSTIPIFMVFIIVGVILTIMRTWIPTAPAFIAIVSPMLIDISKHVSANLTQLMMLAVFWSGSTMLLVFTEPLYLYTYATGRYTAKEFFDVTLPPTIIAIVVMALLFPGWVNLLGF
jgi:di/tricarboxylate transporter